MQLLRNHAKRPSDKFRERRPTPASRLWTCAAVAATPQHPEPPGAAWNAMQFVALVLLATSPPAATTEPPGLQTGLSVPGQCVSPPLAAPRRPWTTLPDHRFSLHTNAWHPGRNPVSHLLRVCPWCQPTPSITGRRHWTEFFPGRDGALTRSAVNFLMGGCKTRLWGFTPDQVRASRQRGQRMTGHGCGTFLTGY